MPIRTWGYVAALGLSLLASTPLEAQDATDEDQVNDQAGEPEPAEERAVEAPAPQIAPEPAEVRSPVHDTAKQEDAESDPVEDPWIWLGDGVAQRAMTFLAAITVGVSWWAVVLLKRTLAATRDAVKQAAAGAEAAQAAVAVTREIGEAQVRAYLKIESAHVYGEDRGTFGAAVTVKNYGQSPAFNVHIVVEFERMLLGDRNLPERLFYSAPVLVGNIQGGQPRETGPVVFNNLRVPEEGFPRPDGSARLQGANVAVFGADVFGQEVFDAVHVLVADTREQWSRMWKNPAAGQFPIPPDFNGPLRA